MTLPIFPVLPGQGFSVHKKPLMSTIVAGHVSGREVRAQRYQNPIWQFEMPIDGLDSSTSGQYSSLGAQSQQALLGLFLQCGGQFATFVYYDPTDYQATAQTFGVGDGTTTSFQLTRALGGFSEGVVAPLIPSAPTPFSLPGSTFYAPNNLITNSSLAGGSMGTPGVFPTGWYEHPSGISGITSSITSLSAVGGLPAITLSISGTPSATKAYQIFVGGAAAGAAGASYINSAYVSMTNTTNVTAQFDCAYYNGATYLNWQPLAIAPTSTLQRFSSVLSPVTGTNLLEPYVALNMTAGQPVSTSITIAAPQIEQTVSGTVPSAFSPTLTTPYYGGPQITVGGVYVDPSTYTIANGIVTFASAPTNGAALTWSGYFGFLCRFDDDTLDFDQFMSNLWRVESLKFRSVRSL